MPQFNLKRFRPDLASLLFITLAGLIVAAPTLSGSSLPLDLAALPPVGELEPPVALDSDTLDFYGRTHTSKVYPAYAFIAHSAARGDSVLWNPMEYMGTPFLAAWKTRCLSPFSIPFYFLSLHAAFGISILLKSCVAGFCAYYTTRKLGYTPWFGVVCAYTFQIGYALVAQPLDPIADALPWVPLLFLFAERAYLKQTRYWPVGAVTIALMLLSGDWVATLCCLLVFISYTLVNQSLYPHEKGYAIPLITFALATIAAVGLIGIQLFPYWAYLADTVSLDTQSKLLPNLTNLPHLFLSSYHGPRHFAFLHVGIIQVLTTGLWLSMRPTLYRHHRIKIDALQFTSLGLLTLTLLYGHLASGTALAATLSHHQLLLPWGFMSALSMVITLSIWLELTPEQCQTIMRSGLKWFSITLVLAIIAVLFLAPPIEWNVTDKTTLAIAILLIMGYGAMLAVTLFRPRIPLVGAMLIILVTIDLSYTNAVNGYRSSLPQLARIGESALAPTTKIAGQLSHPPLPLLHQGVAQNRGTVGRPLKNVYSFLQESQQSPKLIELTPANQILLSLDALEPMNAEVRQSITLATLSPSGLARFELQNHTPDLLLTYQVETVDELDLGELQPNSHPTVYTGAALPPSSNISQPLTWTERPSNTTLKIVVNPTTDAILVLNKVLDNGWTATVDGTPVPLIPVNGIFSGVGVNSTSRDVAFRYAPRSYAMGRLLTLFTLIIVLLGYANVHLHRFRQSRMHI